MLATDGVQGGENIGRRHLVAVDRDDVALGEREFNHLRFVRRFLGRHRDAPHRIFRREIGVFENPALVGNVQQVGIHRVGRTSTLAFFEINRNAVFIGVGQQFVARQQIPLAPRRNHFHIRHQRIGTEFKAHLVVALAGGTVRDGVGFHLACNVDHVFGDQRPGNRGAEQVFAFVQCVGAEHRKHEVAHEFFLEILNEDVLFFDAHLERLGARRFDLFTLADVGGEGHHFAVVYVLQPFEDDRGVEAAGVGQDNLVDLVIPNFVDFPGFGIDARARAVVCFAHGSMLPLFPVINIPSMLFARAAGFRLRPTPHCAARRSLRPRLLRRDGLAGSA